MKLILALFPMLAFGQVTATLTAPATINTGQQAILTITMTALSPPAAIQWLTTFNPNAWVAISSSVGAVPGKSLTCQMLQPGSYLCELDGPNALPIANGVIATITLTAGTVLGSTPLALTTSFASDPSGTGITTTVPAPTSITVTTPQTACDLNSDGKVDQADVTVARTRVLTASALKDLDNSPPWTVIDLQRMQNAASGAACRVG